MMRNLHLYVPSKGSYMANQFYWRIRYEDFSDEDQCPCMYTSELFAYIFFGIRKAPTRKISTNKNPPWWIPPGKFPPRIFPPMFLDIPPPPPPRFLIFFHYFYRYNWYYLTLQCMMSQIGQTHFKNLAVNAARYLKCVWPFWHIMH